MTTVELCTMRLMTTMVALLRRVAADEHAPLDHRRRAAQRVSAVERYADWVFVGCVGPAPAVWEGTKTPCGERPVVNVPARIGWKGERTKSHGVSERQTEILAALVASPDGMTSSAIGRVVGAKSSQSVAYQMRALVEQGKVCRASAAYPVRWRIKEAQPCPT